MPDLSIENNYHNKLIAGVDEAGRGPWAGPVVAAAVIIDPNKIFTAINDSKKLNKNQREILYDLITENYIFAVGMADVTEIDQLNILNASLLAMQRAIKALPKHPDIALIDGNKAPKLSCPAIPIIGGDAKSYSIAAASIIAKVTRDRIMHELSCSHPQYFWQDNAGYGTSKHIAAINQYGVTEHHRNSFKPIKQYTTEGKIYAKI